MQKPIQYIVLSSYLALIGFALSGQASTAAAPTSSAMAPIRILSQPQDHILIKGYRGKVEYVAKDNLSDVTVTAREVEKSGVTAKKSVSIDDWQISVRRENGVVVIIADGPTTKQAWGELLLAGQMSADIPEFDLTVVGPSRPTEISWHEGPIKVEGLNADLHVTTIHSALAIYHGQGDATINIQEGSVDLRERKGQLAIESYNAKVDVMKTEGPLHLENFSGDSLVQMADGATTISTFKGATRLLGLKGNLTFKNGTGPIHVEHFDGELRGQSGQGAVVAEVNGEPDIRITSAEGAVSVKTPEGGSWVNLGTTDGAVFAPNYLKLTRLQTQQIRSGKLHGSGGGSIFVRTTSGEIRLR